MSSFDESLSEQPFVSPRLAVGNNFRDYFLSFRICFKRCDVSDQDCGRKRFGLIPNLIERFLCTGKQFSGFAEIRLLKYLVTFFKLTARFYQERLCLGCRRSVDACEIRCE